MTLEQLRIFLAVVEHLHFTRAADALYITQPAVSAAIQNLEGEYGVKLFHRIGRHIEITEAGKLLHLEAQKILDQVAITERALKELNDLQRGELRLGASFTIGNYWLPQKISKFKQLYPNLSINCTLANAEKIVTGTVTGHFDLGLFAGEVKLSLQNSLEQKIVGSDRLQIVVGKSHPWFQRTTINVRELTTTTWIMREPGSGTQQMFEQALQKWGIAPNKLKVMFVLNSSEMIKTLVEKGVGAAAVPELMVQKEIQFSTLNCVKIEHPTQDITFDIIRPVLLIKHRQRFQTKISKAFETILMKQETKNIRALFEVRKHE
ncbi:transcriptional regulator, LysR family [Stanieria cyanosphaera PCC 7437]|uniref:Transcriptional regulator, LysR family n=1 Tax=Stanieria cyanosphaera (strain ATCC 29371 / PCC 7437) TaxID=111780 RepID=K9XSY1_STAC7|nr:LysR substrate-binding domain-containing protein [Stanieria cyanosphaera]AFZ35186.1 transcriptional regulator, LysR family [Stanieria cyanosphaera PCC 7437]